MKEIIIPLVVISLGGPSCATLKDSALLGAGIGAAAGGASGLAISTATHSQNQTPGVLIGVGAGAIAGAVIGHLAYKSKASRELPPTPVSGGIKNEEPPSLTSPEVRRVWVPAKVEGSKYIDGHHEYIIERGSVWTVE